MPGARLSFFFLELWSVDLYHTAGVMSFYSFQYTRLDGRVALMHIGGQYFSPKETHGALGLGLVVMFVMIMILTKLELPLGGRAGEMLQG